MASGFNFATGLVGVLPVGLLGWVDPEVLSPLAWCVTVVEVPVGVESPMKRLFSDGLPWTDASRVERGEDLERRASGVMGSGASGVRNVDARYYSSMESGCCAKRREGERERKRKKKKKKESRKGRTTEFPFVSALTPSLLRHISNDFQAAKVQSVLHKRVCKPPAVCCC